MPLDSFIASIQFIMRQTVLIFLVSFLIGQTAFGQDNNQEQRRPATAARPDIPGTLRFDIGANFFSNVPDPLTINAFRSKGVGIYYLWNFDIAESNFTFSPGLGVGLERYDFSGPNTLLDTDEGAILVPLDSIFGQANFQKSRLVANYVDIPLEVSYNSNKIDPRKSFNVTLGAKVGFLFSSHMKVKYVQNDQTKINKQKEQYSLNRFRYGAYARIGYSWINVYGYAAISELFEPGSAPLDATVTPWQVGLSFDLF